MRRLRVGAESVAVFGVRNVPLRKTAVERDGGNAGKWPCDRAFPENRALSGGEGRFDPGSERRCGFLAIRITQMCIATRATTIRLATTAMYCCRPSTPSSPRSACWQTGSLSVYRARSTKNRCWK